MAGGKGLLEYGQRLKSGATQEIDVHRRGQAMATNDVKRGDEHLIATMVDVMYEDIIYHHGQYHLSQERDGSM